MSRTGSFKSLAEWLAWLETLTPNEIELGLERVAAVLQRLSLKKPGRVIHVAGTNGKGSCVAMLEVLYLQKSSSVGAYTSPHIHRYNERIRIAGAAVLDDLILEAFERVESVRDNTPLTYFEYGTLAALCIFDAAAIETVILEIGMGGRLDAVNAVEPDGGIVTNVSLDHCGWLGHDIETIAAEKAGIFRQNKPFVFASDNVPKSVNQVANDVGARLRSLNTDYRFSVESTGRWCFAGRDTTVTELDRPTLHGHFQIQNAAGVLALVEALCDRVLLNNELINTAFSSLTLPGRMQLIERKRIWLVDAAHNPAAATVLADSITASQGCVGTCIIGVLNDKDVAGIVEPLLNCVDRWISVPLGGPRATPAAELARVISNLSNKPCLVADSVAAACGFADGRPGDLNPVLITGSFLTVGPALQWLETHRNGR